LFRHFIAPLSRRIETEFAPKGNTKEDVIPILSETNGKKAQTRGLNPLSIRVILKISVQIYSVTWTPDQTIPSGIYLVKCLSLPIGMDYDFCFCSETHLLNYQKNLPLKICYGINYRLYFIEFII